MNQHKSKKQLLFTRKSCVVATEFALAMMAAPFAFAQASPPAVKIEVTGSRIPLQQNVESTSPISVISAEDIKIEGVHNIENLLQNMPQVFADQGSTVSNGASGTATVSLRNLGPDRTLVLVNGKRMPAGGPRDRPERDRRRSSSVATGALHDLQLGCRRGRGELHHARNPGRQGDISCGFTTTSRQLVSSTGGARGDQPEPRSVGRQVL